MMSKSKSNVSALLLLSICIVINLSSVRQVEGLQGVRTRRCFPSWWRNPFKKAEICVICHDKLPTKPKSLPCGHHYCSGCIDAWLEVNNNCPICRSPQEQQSARAIRAARRATERDQVRSDHRHRIFRVVQATILAMSFWFFLSMCGVFHFVGIAKQLEIIFAVVREKKTFLLKFHFDPREIKHSFSSIIVTSNFHVSNFKFIR